MTARGSLACLWEVRARQLSFERRIRLSLYLLGLPLVVLCWLLLYQHGVAVLEQSFVLVAVALGWMFAVSLLMEQIVRPLQTLSNVVAARCGEG